MKLSTRNLLIFATCVYSVLPVFSDGFEYRANTMLQSQFSDYMDNVRIKIAKAWTPPDTMESGHVVVKFKVDRKGEIFDAEVINSSGNELYDESTLEALKKSAPFDNFPQSSNRDYITIKYDFETSVAKSDTVKAYAEKADKLYGINNQEALKYINIAINEVNGDIGSYFLYAKRSKIRAALGDTIGAKEDFAECKKLKEKYDKKRIIECKIIAEMDKSAFAYFYLANAYDIAGDYDNAITAIDKAISLTELNNNYKRYKIELLRKRNNFHSAITD